MTTPIPTQNIIRSVCTHIYRRNLDGDTKHLRRIEMLVLAASIMLKDEVSAAALQSILRASTPQERQDVRQALCRIVKKRYLVRTDLSYGNRYKSNVLTEGYGIAQFPWKDTLQLVESHIDGNDDPYGKEILRSLAYEGKYPDSLPYVQETSPTVADEIAVPYFDHFPSLLKSPDERPWKPLGPALFYLATLEFLHEEPLSLGRFKVLIGGSLTTFTNRLTFMLQHDHIWQVIPTMSLMTKGQGRKPTRLSIKEPGIQAMNELRKIHDRFKDQREYHHFYTAIKNYLHAAIPSDKALRFNALEPVSKPTELQKLDGGTAA